MCSTFTATMPRARSSRATVTSCGSPSGALFFCADPIEQLDLEIAQVEGQLARITRGSSHAGNIRLESQHLVSRRQRYTGQADVRQLALAELGVPQWAVFDGKADGACRIRPHAEAHVRDYGKGMRIVDRDRRAAPAPVPGLAPR